MQFNQILTLILISVLLFTVYQRPWVTVTKDFKVTRMFAGMNVLLLGVAFFSLQHFTPDYFPKMGPNSVQMAGGPTTASGMIVAVSSALSWLTLFLTLRGVFAVLGLKAPDPR